MTGGCSYYRELNETNNVCVDLSGVHCRKRTMQMVKKARAQCGFVCFWNWIHKTAAKTRGAQDEKRSSFLNVLLTHRTQKPRHR